MMCLLCEGRRRKRDAAMCDYCTARVRLALVNAPAVYVRASTVTAARNSALSERVSTSAPASRSPVQDGVLEAADDLYRALRDWHNDYALASGRPELPALVRQGVAVQRASDILTASLDAALSLPVGVVRAARLLSVTKMLRDRTGMTPLVHKLAAPCPACDARALIRRDGDDHVSCRMCRQSWPERHYALLTRALVAEAGDTANRHDLTRHPMKRQEVTERAKSSDHA